MATWHTYQILTKRLQRLARFSRSLPWPSHIWIGVSVESNAYTWRADYLRQVPAAVRFISAEPLLGPVNELNLEGLHWVITGGESGAGHRRCDPAWVRDVRDRCVDEGVAYFHKQWGGRTPKAGGGCSTAGHGTSCRHRASPKSKHSRCAEQLELSALMD